MTRKELILRMMSKLPEDVTYDRVMYHLDVMKAVEIGMEEIARGEVIPHEQVMAELLADEKSKADLGSKRKTRSKGNSEAHRKGSSPNGQRVRAKTAKSRGKSAKVS